MAILKQFNSPFSYQAVFTFQCFVSRAKPAFYLRISDAGMRVATEAEN